MQNSEKKQCQFEAMNGAISEMLAVILKNSRVEAFEYLIEEDRIVLYDKTIGSVRSITEYLSYVETNPHLFDEDRWKMKEFFQGKLRGPVEVRVRDLSGRNYRKLLDGSRMRDRFNDQVVLVGSSRDITMEKSLQEQLKEKASRDSLTGLYNHSTGKELINDYLRHLDSHTSCGMIILDIDYFKNINDTYGHLFGDRVLSEFAHLFQMFFEQKDILMRAGGDEFVILMKDISHGALVKKVAALMDEVRGLDFKEGYLATCSVGISFLPANTRGYTYNQMFSNADRALYRAKAQGRNRFVFCDMPEQFENSIPGVRKEGPLEPRDFRRDILSVAEYDSLTGLLSFTRFREEMDRMIVGGNAVSYVVIFSDFAGFKYFNQKCGYHTGDQVLREFASHIIESIQHETGVYFTRVVADQFILFLPTVKALKQVAEDVHRINAEFVQRQQQRFPGIQFKVRSGIYRIPPDCVSASAAIDAANYARRQIRENDRESVCVYDKVLEKRYRLEHEIRYGLNSALEQQQMKVCFQPRVSLADHTMLGAEALLRWERPDGSVMYPGDFIPLYEQTGRILELDFYVLEKIAEFLERCIREGKKVVPISINFSILHTAADNTVERFLEILKRHGIAPSLIEVELTETATAAEYEKVRRLFKKLQEAGIRTALDDFGAGYSVLNMVLDVPLNTIKVDKNFLNSCFVRTKGHLFLEKLIPLLNGMGYHVVCEGVETERQEEFVRQAGCNEVQGNLFFGVLSMEEFEQKLNE